jgi:hypothetical protein
VQVVGVQDREGLFPSVAATDSPRKRTMAPAAAEPANTSRRDGAMFDVIVKGFFQWS